MSRKEKKTCLNIWDLLARHNHHQRVGMREISPLSPSPSWGSNESMPVPRRFVRRRPKYREARGGIIIRKNRNSSGSSLSSDSKTMRWIRESDDDEDEEWERTLKKTRENGLSSSCVKADKENFWSGCERRKVLFFALKCSLSMDPCRYGERSRNED